MKIAVVGAGPAGLYFSILMKKTNPEYSIEVYEQNQFDDIFGFGVVFNLLQCGLPDRPQESGRLHGRPRVLLGREWLQQAD